MTFQEARAKLAEISGWKFRKLNYSLSEYSSGRVCVECQVYIEDTKLAFGEPTWEEAFEAHSKAQLPIDEQIDVSEMPTETPPSATDSIDLAFQ